MLLGRPRRMTRSREEMPASHAVSEESVATSARVLPRTNVYASSRTKPASPGKPSPGRRLLSLLGGGESRSLSRLLAKMSPPELVAASTELLDEGYAFARVGRRGLRLRHRRRGERRQSLADVFDRLSFWEPAKVAPAPVPHVEEDFDLGVDPEISPGSETSLVLSEPPADLSLPVEGCATATRAILARRGSGKTYLAGVLVEEMLAHSDVGTVLVIDPGGAWWGLLAEASGGSSSLPVLLLGGPRGHLPVRAADGARVADVLGEVRPRAVVLDLSELAPVEQHGVVADLFERLWALPHFLLHAVVDEADEFAPQRFGALPRHQRRSLEQLGRTIMRGRVRGMGATLVSLRPAVLSKNLLSQVDELFLGCFVEPHDIRAAATWLENHEDHVPEDRRVQCLGQLPVLPPGIFYYLRGGERSAFRRFRARKKRTYDSSRTMTADFRPDPRLGAPAPEILARAAEVMGRPGEKVEGSEVGESG
jgi:hypothetical protein